jgi:hypothetical protein
MRPDQQPLRRPPSAQGARNGVRELGLKSQARLADRTPSLPILPTLRSRETPASHALGGLLLMQSSLVLAQHLEAVLALELGHPLGVHEVMVVFACEFGAPLGELLRRAGLGELAQLGEEPPEPRGPDDLEQVRRLGTGVPEGVRDAARLEDVAARSSYVVPVADPYPDLSAQNVGQLVLPVPARGARRAAGRLAGPAGAAPAAARRARPRRRLPDLADPGPTGGA